MGVITTGMIIAGALTAASSPLAGLRAVSHTKTSKAYNKFVNTLESYGIKDVDTKDIITELYFKGDITLDEHKKALSILNEVENEFKDNDKIDFWQSLNHTSNTYKNVRKLYSFLTSKVPDLGYDIAKAFKELPDGVKDTLGTGSVPQVGGVAGPNYEDVNFKGEQLEVDPVKLWTGQELADLHSLNFDPNSYYDLVKQGTSAGVDYSKYTSDQLAHAAGVEDTKNVTSYLDAIRNTKAESLAAGATLGARAANEILANTESINNYANNQNAAAQERFNAVSSSLLEDAKAKLTAKSYYENLAKSLSNDSALLYANDTDRFGQEMLSNAEMYKADQELRGQRAYSNASMYANWLQANAGVNASRQSMYDTANEFEWVFNNFVRANGGDYQAAKYDMNPYLFKKYVPDYNNIVDMYNAIK
jgi:hypothetical protein